MSYAPNDKPMDPLRFELEMEAVYDNNSDPGHILDGAVGLACECLQSVGYSNGVEVFKEIIDELMSQYEFTDEW